MKDLTKAIITGAIMGACLFAVAKHSNAAEATGGAVASADHGHHGYGAGVSGSLKGASSSASQGAVGGNGGSYFSPDLHSSLVDDYQPWPESEMRQFQRK
jgi:hypothetical protein